MPAGEEVTVVEKLLAARDAETKADPFDGISGRRANHGEAPTDKSIAAAASAVGAGPVVFLVGARLADDPTVRPVLEKFAAAIGANAESGMLGSPSVTVNGRGALDLAGDIVAADRENGNTAARAAAGELSTVLLLGGEHWPSTGSAKKIVLTAGAVDPDDMVEVVLPIAHAYEQAGSFTNLEGRVQQLQAGGLPPQGVPTDWQAISTLVQKLGGSAPSDLKAIRAALSDAHPAYKITETRTGRQGRLMLPLA